MSREMDGVAGPIMNDLVRSSILPIGAISAIAMGITIGFHMAASMMKGGDPPGSEIRSGYLRLSRMAAQNRSRRGRR